MPERMSESMLERMSDRMSEYVFNIYFQMVCQKLCQGENHSKTFFLFLSFFLSFSLSLSLSPVYIYILISLYIYLYIYIIYLYIWDQFSTYICNYIYTERRYSGDSLKSLLNALDLDIVGVFQGFWTPFGGFCRWMKTLRILWSTPINAPKWAFGVYHFKGAAFKRPIGVHSLMILCCIIF